MNDDGARGPLARGALVLVDPAPVVEPALAGEQIRIPVRVVVHHHEDLPREVRALVVVPLELWRLDAVTDEHQLGVIDRDALLLQAAHGDVVLTPGEVDTLGIALKAPELGHLRADADDIERLLPRTVGKPGLVAHAFEPGLQVQTRELVATRARS